LFAEEILTASYPEPKRLLPVAVDQIPYLIVANTAIGIPVENVRPSCVCTHGTGAIFCAGTQVWEKIGEPIHFGKQTHALALERKGIETALGNAVGGRMNQCVGRPNEIVSGSAGDREGNQMLIKC